MRVLLVEDSDLVRERLVAMLTEVREVDQVMAAATVSEALRRLAEETATVVVLDMRLPDGDGFRVLRAARALRPAPAVVVLTSFADEEMRSTCLEAGAAEFLDKRTDFERLPAVVTELAGQVM